MRERGQKLVFHAVSGFCLEACLLFAFEQRYAFIFSSLPFGEVAQDFSKASKFSRLIA